MFRCLKRIYLNSVERIKNKVPGTAISLYDIEDDLKIAEEIKTADIFINATNVGMKPFENESVVKDISILNKKLVVADVVYNPLETKLLREAGEKGCICINGKGMLLWQGVYAFKLYTGKDMPVEEVRNKFF